MKGLCCGCIVVLRTCISSQSAVATDNSLLHPIPSGCRRCHLLHCWTWLAHCKIPPPIILPPIHSPKRDAERSKSTTLKQAIKE
eukprot:scaffold7657_cov115-Skeletonema_dohrnii-CCMP3373.AAC.3